jgi:penicillin-binding protein 1A
MPLVPDIRPPIADPGSTFQIVTMLQGVVERGTGTAVRAVGKPIAGKTGTTNDFRDAWFVGFTPDLAAGVYIGYDDPDSLGDDETGGHVFRDFMISALKDAPATPFRSPPGIRLYRVNPGTGLSAAAGGPAIDEAYKDGTEPGRNHSLGLQPESGEDGTPVASSREEQAREPTWTALPTRTVPASGTGGLY